MDFLVFHMVFSLRWPRFFCLFGIMASAPRSFFVFFSVLIFFGLQGIMRGKGALSDSGGIALHLNVIPKGGNGCSINGAMFLVPIKWL